MCSLTRRNGAWQQGLQERRWEICSWTPIDMGADLGLTLALRKMALVLNSAPQPMMGGSTDWQCVESPFDGPKWRRELRNFWGRCAQSRSAAQTSNGTFHPAHRKFTIS